MNRHVSVRPIFTACLILIGTVLRGAEKPARFYFIDVGLGNATLVVAPSGQTMLLDTGTRRTTNRLLDALKAAGAERIDYLVSTHYHDDHFGAAAEIAERIQVVNFVDHGPSVESGKGDEWWKERRGPWFQPGKGKLYDESMEAYTKAREKGRHLVVKAGDVIPIEGLEVRVVTAGAKAIDKPLPGAGAANPAGSGPERPGRDDAEDAQSIGVLITHGKFRFVYLGDLTWNESLDLFSPVDKVGPVDAYVVTHHAQSFPREMGDYYWGLSACPPAELSALRPRVAILSLGSLGHKGGNADAINTVLASPGLENLWQMEKIMGGGEAGHNPPDDFIANINFGGRPTPTPPSPQAPPSQARPAGPAPHIKLSAHADGSFEMTNSRNGFSKQYPVRQ